MASVELARLLERRRELMRGAPYTSDAPEVAELGSLNAQEREATRFVPRKDRTRVWRLAEDHARRMARREEDGPSFELERRLREMRELENVIHPGLSQPRYRNLPPENDDELPVG